MKGRTKIMYSSKGVPRIQEERGDTIKVYSLNEWNKELANRASEPVEEKTEEAELGIQEDTDEESAPVARKITNKRTSRARKDN